jgi:voltage-gated potassium channel
MDERSTRVARRLEPWLTAASLLVIPVLLIEATDLGGPWATIAAVVDWASWLVFVVELVVMLAIVPDRRRWLADNPLEVAIVVLTPPFVAGIVQSLRLLRLLRLVRISGLFSLVGVKYAALLAALTAVAGGEAFASAEDLSPGDGLYWSLTTMTTVGYGDVTPTTSTGKLVAILVILVGVGFVAILTGAIAQHFIAPGEERIEVGEQALHDKLDALTERIDQLESALRRHS